MSYKIVWNLKKARSIPKKLLALWFLLFFLFSCCVVTLLQPADAWLDSVQTVEAVVDRISLKDSHATKGSRMQLILVSGDQTYYLWYPRDVYAQYADSIHAYSLSQSPSIVTVSYLENSTLWDRLLRQYKIVELRCEHSMLYDLEQEIARTQKEYNNTWFVLILYCLFLLPFSVFLLLSYGVITFRKICRGGNEL